MRMDRGIPTCLFRRPFGRATSSFFPAWRRSIRRPGERTHGTVAAETRQILTNMTELLEAAGSSLAHVVKVNVLIYSMLEYENMNSVYREFFPADPPARTVCGTGLLGGHKVEIDCIALVAGAEQATTQRLHRGVIEPGNPKLNVSRNANLPHS